MRARRWGPSSTPLLGKPGHGVEAERCKSVPLAVVELAHELDPVEPQRVQVSGEALHADEESQVEHGPDEEEDCDVRPGGEHVLRVGSPADSSREDHVPEDLWQLWK